MKEAGELVVMENEQKKKNILFARDMSLPCAKYVKDRPQHFLNFMKDAWAKIKPLDHNARVGFLKDRGIEAVGGFRVASKALPDDMEPKKRNKRSNFKFVNKWVSREFRPDFKKK